MISSNIQNIWQECIEHMKAQYGEEVSKEYIEVLELGSVANESLYFHISNSFVKQWVETHYIQEIEKFISSKISSISSVYVLYRNKSFTTQLSKQDEDNIVSYQKQDDASKFGNIQGIQLHDHCTFENFVADKSNEFAFNAAKSIAESEKASSMSNPLFLYGGVGLGKTHLMQSIVREIQSNQGERRVLYISAEQFAYQYIRSLRDKNIINFKDSFRSVDVLMVDDVQFISGKDNTQEEFFHTFNSIIDQGKQLVISADCSPSDLTGVRDRIKSRLAQGIVADINPASYELRLGVLQSRTQLWNVEIDNSVLEFMATELHTNIRELEGAFNNVVTKAKLLKMRIDVNFVKSSLKDVLRSSQKSISINDIKKTVCEYYNVKISDLSSKSRKKIFVHPRQIAMYLSSALTSKSSIVIGDEFGGRDHTTVLHACKKIDDDILNKLEISEEISVLKKRLGIF